MEKKNVLYLTYEEGYVSNFYHGIKRLTISNVIQRSDIDSLSLQSYDAYIIDFSIFYEKEINCFIDRILLTEKPVIIIYSSKLSLDFSFFKYCSDKFGISFEKKDCSIIENSYDDYSISDEGKYAISMIYPNGHRKAFIKNTQNCFILRFKNISIIHDTKIFGNGIKIPEVTYMNLLNIPKEIIKPVWVNDLLILDDEIIKDTISQIDKKIKKARHDKELELQKLEKNEEYKKLLYTSGDELVEAVKIVLFEMLNTKINDVDLKKEDLSLVLEDKKILIEIKGVNDPIKRSNVSQLQRHIEDDAQVNNIEDNDIPKKYKGLLIINPYIKTPVKERIKKDFYSEIVKKDIVYHDICAIDTITLLSYFQKYKAGQKINLKNIILNTNYNEPDFSVLKI